MINSYVAKLKNTITVVAILKGINIFLSDFGEIKYDVIYSFSP